MNHEHLPAAIEEDRPANHAHAAPADAGDARHRHARDDDDLHRDAHDHGHSHEQDHEHSHDHDHGHEHPSGIRGFLHELFVPHTHDTADSIDSAMESSAQGIRAVKISLLGLGLTAVFQLAIVAVSGSVALLADTVHNFSDALTAVPLWIAFLLGRRAATRRYNFGFGRAEDLAGLFIVAMIALSAVVAAVESIRRFFEPQPVENLGWVFAAGLIGFAGNELVALYRIRVGRRIGSAALVADGVHARTDGFTSLAVVAGVIAIWLGFPLADPIVGLLISAAITVLLWGTARDIGRRLMDGVDPALLDRADRALAEVAPAGTGVRMRWSGHRLHILVSCPLDGTASVAELHQLQCAVDAALRRALPNVGEVELLPTVA
ncbi:cation diffusion facilitator family transporter [Arthrobacter crystallopoietes BAB-32]|uniref:Cation diffusion facilitator family transporter n=1 Tax=Arthrobacter crystallopoietes BAB-32 TaxID=1246476 RepID=N1UYC0_9MICC|nr:cation diffusion facilitator family transporter [Arthrobacter crystallopoietes]EMY32769.1 cation diffusion facilitator family transporter [Arthrobacter crystallopoietes BAB-32]